MKLVRLLADYGAGKQLNGDELLRVQRTGNQRADRLIRKTQQEIRALLKHAQSEPLSCRETVALLHLTGGGGTGPWSPMRVWHTEHKAVQKLRNAMEE